MSDSCDDRPGRRRISEALEPPLADLVEGEVDTLDQDAASAWARKELENALLREELRARRSYRREVIRILRRNETLRDYTLLLASGIIIAQFVMPSLRTFLGADLGVLSFSGLVVDSLNTFSARVICNGKERIERRSD